MKKIKLSQDFRKLLAEKLLDLGNLAAAALVFGQIISGKEFSIFILIIGLFLMVLCYIISSQISS